MYIAARTGDLKAVEIRKGVLVYVSVDEKSIACLHTGAYRELAPALMDKSPSAPDKETLATVRSTVTLVLSSHTSGLRQCAAMINLRNAQVKADASPDARALV